MSRKRKRDRDAAGSLVLIIRYDERRQEFDFCLLFHLPQWVIWRFQEGGRKPPPNTREGTGNSDTNGEGGWEEREEQEQVNLKGFEYFMTPRPRRPTADYDDDETRWQCLEVGGVNLGSHAESEI